jgi:hypothetical protein
LILNNFMKNTQPLLRFGDGASRPMPWVAAAVLDLLLAPLLLCAVVWVHWRQAVILRSGARLNPAQRELAQALGIVAVDQVRVASAALIPMPLPRWARGLAQRTGWISQHIAGMTLGHGIVLREDYSGDVRLLAHELAHVSQYERLGGIAPFLRQYLRECTWPGYPHGALEREARAAEARAAAPAADVIPYRTITADAADGMAPPRTS